MGIIEFFVSLWHFRSILATKDAEIAALKGQLEQEKTGHDFCSRVLVRICESAAPEPEAPVPMDKPVRIARRRMSFGEVMARYEYENDRIKKEAAALQEAGVV